MFSNISGNTIIAFSFRVIGTIISIVYLAVLTRYLGIENFGYYSGALAYVYIFSFLADLGLYNLMIREISLPNADESKIASNIFTLRVLALLISLTTGSLIIWFTDFNIVMKIAVVISSFHFLFLGASQPLIGIFQKHLRIFWHSISEIFSRAFQLGFIFLVIYLGGGVISIVSGFALAALIAFIIMIIGLRGLVKIKLRFDFFYIKWVLYETWPMAAIVIFASIYFKIDEVMLSFLKTPTDVGIYSAGYKAVQSLVFFPAMFVGFLMPKISFYSKKNLDKFKIVFQYGFKALFLMAAPIVIGLYFRSSDIMILIAGPEFLISGKVLQILSLAIFMIFLSQLFTQSAIALGKQKQLAIIYFLGMIFNVVANFILIPYFSYIGASVTTLVTESFIATLTILYLIRIINIKINFKELRYIILSSVALILFLYLTSFNLFLTIGISIIIYIGILLLTGEIKHLKFTEV